MGAQVLAVVIPKMIVAGDGSELDARVDEEINQSRLHLGLAGLEVVSTDKSFVLLCKFDGTWNKGILWGAVDEWCTLKDTSDCKDSGGSNLLMAGLDCLNEIVGSVIDALENVRITFGIGSPLHDHLIKVVGSLEFTIDGLALKR